MDYLPVLAAVYNYYPFGMLMPGRYISDDAQKCITSLTTTLVPRITRVYIRQLEPIPLPPQPGPPIVVNQYPWGPVRQLPISTTFTAQQAFFYNYLPASQHDIGWIGRVTPGGGGYELDLSNEPTGLSFYLPFALDTGAGAGGQVLGFTMGMLPAGVQLEARVRHYSSTADDDNYEEVLGWRPVHQGEPVQLRFDPSSIVNGSVDSRLVAELRFSTERGAPQFATGMRVGIQNPWTEKTEWVTETRLVTLCEEKDKYRYGFNGQEKDNEVAGVGNSYDFGERIYESRLGRFMSRDPLATKFPYYSPYQFAGNKPIAAIDLDGLEEFYAIDGRLIGAGNPDDKRKMLALYVENAKYVRNKDATVRSLMHQLDNRVWDIVSAPTPAAINLMEEAYTKGDNQEFGFVTGRNADGEFGVSSLIPGGAMEVDLIPGIKELRDLGFTPLSGGHLHPTGYTGDLKSEYKPIGVPTPSSKNNSSLEEFNDIDNQEERLSKGIFTESSLVIGLKYENVERFSMPGGPSTIGGTQQEVKRTRVATYHGGSEKKQKTINFSTLKTASQRIYGK